MEQKLCRLTFCQRLKPRTGFLCSTLLDFPGLFEVAYTDVITRAHAQLHLAVQETDLLCRRGLARRSPHSAGRARSRLWRPEHQVELAPHVAGRASFTAWRGGGGAERARGSCDRRLAKYRPSTADVCACAPLLALSPHLGRVETG